MAASHATTLGPFLMGIFLNTFLFGLVTYQFAAYYRAKFNDPPAMKYMVLFLFILDIFHSAIVVYMAWYYTVTKYDHPQATSSAMWPYQFTPLGTALAALVTQTFLGFRIWRLTGKLFLYGIVMVLAIPSFLLSLVCSIEAWTIYSSSTKLARITPVVIAWLVMQVAVDTYVTVTLVISLHFSRTGFRKMDTALNRLIRGAIQTGLFAGIFSIGILITFVVLPKTSFYGIFLIPIGRVYTNTLMDSLLSRRWIKAAMVDNPDMTGAIGPIGRATTDSSQASLAPGETAIRVDVQKTVVETRDESVSGVVEKKLAEEV